MESASVSLTSVHAKRDPDVAITYAHEARNRSKPIRSPSAETEFLPIPTKKREGFGILIRYDSF